MRETRTAKPLGRVACTITWLETFGPPRRAPLQPPVQGTEVVRAIAPPVHFYRYLYDTVGAGWLWNRRRLMGDEALAAIVQAPAIDIRVLWLHGVPAGFAELDFSDFPDVGMSLFGLMPEFIGQRLGPWFLDWAIRHAFHKGATRFHLNTCDLDHPKALATYEAAGLEAYDRAEAFETLIEGMALPAHARNRPVLPLA